MDAFTDRAFAGNPAGVCVVERWPDAPRMQRVAAELNLSETAFARPRPDGDWGLRWLTPTVEVDICGHATLATAHALAEDELIDDVPGPPKAEKPLNRAASQVPMETVGIEPTSAGA